jgi:hypothetical protein
MAIYKPISKAKSATIKSAKLNKTPGASLKHVILGLPIYMVASATDMTEAKLKQSIKIDITNTKTPIKITGAASDIVEMAQNLSEWMEACADAIPKVQEIAEKLELIP